ncbi:MAG: SusC/RagA family TonB-linked outer membrane protein, partial [Bacteroidota bacterium]
NTDWQDLMYRDAVITSHNLSVRGSNEKTAYSFSLGHLNQDGIVLGTNTKQYTARLNLDTRVTDKFNYSLKLSSRYDDVNQPVTGAGTIVGWIDRGTPIDPVYTEEGEYAYSNLYFGKKNPVAGAKEGKNRSGWYNLMASLSGEYEFIEGLKLTGTAGVRNYHNLRKVFRPLVVMYDPADPALTKNLDVGGTPLSAYNSYQTNLELTFVSTLSYNKTFGENHNLGVLAGFNQETSTYNWLSASKNGLPSNALQEINAGSVDPTASGYSVDFGLQSYFGRITYNYDSKYLFEANARYDGSSNFAEGNKWGLFPSFSGAWNIASESFMENITAIDMLKLRASWGQLGNQQIPPNQYNAFFTLGQSYSYGGALVGGAAQTNLPNPDVTWETSNQTDVGMNLIMWGGKMQLETAYYIKVTDDILRPVNISTTIGALSPPTVNLASVENKGWEVFLTHKNRIGDFSYTAGFNFTTNKNKVIALPTPVINTWSWLEEGRPIDEFYAIKMLGIFQDEEDVIAHGAQPTAKPGDIKFEDFDGDGDIDGDDRQPAGNSIPNIIYGFDLSAEYKGFDFSMLWQGVEGSYARTEEEQKPFFNFAGLPQFWLDNAWTAENPNNEYPRLVRSSNYVNNIWRNGTTFLIEDASFLRLKNVQLGYTLPKSLLSKIRIDHLRIYVNASNPLTFTKYRGLDPEKGAFQSRSSYSNVQVYTIGLNVTF